MLTRAAGSPPVVYMEDDAIQKTERSRVTSVVLGSELLANHSVDE